MSKNVNNKTNINRKLLLAVAFDEDTSTYNVDIAQGSSVPETAFAMSVVIKCLVRDGIVKDPKEITQLILKYLDDPQYQELKETK